MPNAGEIQDNCPSRKLVRYFGTGYFETIRNLELKVSNILEHNDPFESVFTTGGELTKENVRQLFMSRRNQWDGLMSKIQQKYPNLRSRKAQERHFLGNLDRYIQNYIDAVESTRADIARTGRAVIERSLRVVCFTALTDEPESVRFWAHYADNSAGARIHFEIPQAELVNLKEISYAADRPIIDLTVDPQSPTGMAQFHKLLITKDKIWSDEVERRLFVNYQRCVTRVINGRKVEFLRIASSWIKMLDFGCKCEAARIEEVLEFVRRSNYPIRVRKAELPSSGARVFNYSVLHEPSG